MEPSALSGFLTGVQTDMLGSIGEALPVAGVIFASVAGILIGVKLFKKLTGART
jgi:hypothetical protein